MRMFLAQIACTITKSNREFDHMMFFDTNSRQGLGILHVLATI